MALDFSLLGQGPQFGNVLASYDAGREARKEQDVKGALALYDTNPEQGVAAMMKVDPVNGTKLRSDLAARQKQSAIKEVVQTFDSGSAASRDKAIATGDPDAVAAWSALDKPAREAAQEKAKAIGTAAFGILRSAPGATPEDTAKRAALVKQVAPLWIANGIPQEQVDGLIANPAPEALEQFILGSDAVLKMRIDDENQQRDDARAAAQNEEMAGYRDLMAKAAGVRAGAAVTNANRPRATNSGQPRQAAPVRTYTPDEVKFD